LDARSTVYTAGTTSSTLTTVSVTRSVFVRRWKKAVSPNAPSREMNGPSVRWSRSAAQGVSAAVAGKVRVRPRGKPRNSGGRSTGTAYWPGVSQTVAPGKDCAKTPA